MQHFPNYFCKRFVETFLKAWGVNLAESLKNYKRLNWLNNKKYWNLQIQKHILLKIKKINWYKGTQSTKENQKNTNRKNKHATKVMLSMKLKIDVRKVQKNVKRQNGLSCQFLKSLLANFWFCFIVPIFLLWLVNLFVVLLYRFSYVWILALKVQ